MKVEDEKAKDINEKDLCSDSKEECKCDEKDTKNNEVQDLKKELDTFKDMYYRANADFENIKKRMEKEKDSAVAFANEKFAKDLLPILDALEEAVKIDVKDNEFAKKIKDGVEQCLNMFKKDFEKYGITPIPTDIEFNPEFHHAINTVEKKDAKSGDIVQVYQKGYFYKDRVLRASMVVIAK